MTSIGNYAFWSCTGLTSITIPNSVASISIGAFYDCKNLSYIRSEIEVPFEIDENVFKYYDDGTGTDKTIDATLYVPIGSKSIYETTNGWNNFPVIKEYPNSDVNSDGNVNVVDVVDIARYVVGTPSAQFDRILADLNMDKTVNVADAVLVVNEIVGETNWTRRFNGIADKRGVLSLTRNDDHSLSLCMEDEKQYTAFQFDLIVPEGTDVQMQLNSLRRQGHQLTYNKVEEGKYRVVALSLSNNVFSRQQGEVLNICLSGASDGDILIDNIHFVTVRGTDHHFDALLSSGAKTDLHRASALERGASTFEQGASTAYRLNGIKQSDARRGVNIVKGKKYVNK